MYTYLPPRDYRLSVKNPADENSRSDVSSAASTESKQDEKSQVDQVSTTPRSRLPRFIWYQPPVAQAIACCYTRVTAYGAVFVHLYTCCCYGCCWFLYICISDEVGSVYKGNLLECTAFMIVTCLSNVSFL